MLRKTLVFLLVSLDVLLYAHLHSAIHALLVSIVVFILPLDDEEGSIVTNYLRVYRIKGTPAKRQIVYSI
jgi:hypothetical protein